MQLLEMMIFCFDHDFTCTMHERMPSKVGAEEQTEGIGCNQSRAGAGVFN